MENKIIIKNTEIEIKKINEEDYVSLTDIAKLINKKDPQDLLKYWFRKVDTLDFLILYEKLNNRYFKLPDFGGFKNKPGSNAFTISPKKWIEMTNAKGIIVKSGKYNGGTFAHKDIALEFAGFLSVEIKLYIIKEFQRLKEEENKDNMWETLRISSKLNYLLQTEEIQNKLKSIKLNEYQINYYYANEADLLNMALFGLTSLEWKSINKDKKGNIRDYASSIELLILFNLEVLNSSLIKENKTMMERLIILNKEDNRETELFNRYSK